MTGAGRARSTLCPAGHAAPSSRAVLVAVLSAALEFRSAGALLCEVPNYRYYRFTPTQARGFAASDSLTCFTAPKPDGCLCIDETECLSGYCVPNAIGQTVCQYPIIQLSEVEFWRKGRRVRTGKVSDASRDAVRIMNAVDIPQTWGVYELEFYADTLCTDRLEGGSVIASSQLSQGFGHSVADGLTGIEATGSDAARTNWQATTDEIETFPNHGPAELAFDADQRTNWWAACVNGCRSHTEWIGLSFNDTVSGVKCVRVVQDRDREYSAFSIAVQARAAGGDWDTLTTFNVGTLSQPYGGLWLDLPVPQGVAFIASTAHARSLDMDVQSSVVELVGTPLVYDFGVETEVDRWRWATADEPTENQARLHDGFTCDRDGLCPRDPVQWVLEGSLDNVNWITLQSQSTVFPVTKSRRCFIPFQSVRHQVAIGIDHMWPDGRGQCAARR